MTKHPITFAIKPHSVYRDTSVVEILLDGAVVGIMTPDQKAPSGVRIISVHITKGTSTDPDFAGRVIEDAGGIGLHAIPAINISFLPSEWHISADGKIVRPSRN